MIRKVSPMPNKKTPSLAITDDDLKGEPYTFSIRGKVHSLPSLDQLPMDLALKIGEEADAVGAAKGLHLLLDSAAAETRKAVLALPINQALRVFQGWMGQSEVTPGESESSETSSGSIAEQ